MSPFHLKYHILTLGAVLALSVPSLTHAATVPNLSFDITQKTIEVNDTFTVKVLVDTTDQDIAGIDAKIKFIPELLRVQNIKNGSVFKDYPDSSYDNDRGSISISAIAPSKNAQFKGKGELAEIRFKAVHVGTDNLRFLFGQGLTNESNLAVTYGNGDILEQVSAATIEIKAKGHTNTSSKNSENDNAQGNTNTTSDSNEEVLSATADGQEGELNENGTRSQTAVTNVVQSQKQPVLGAFSGISISPKDWDKTTLLALLFVNVAAIGVIGTLLIRHQKSLS